MLTHASLGLGALSTRLWRRISLEKKFVLEIAKRIPEFGFRVPAASPNFRGRFCKHHA
jgi:hypothetical protein